MARRQGAGRPRDDARQGRKALETSAMLRFARQGYEATPLREIAADAGVDVALVSYHFGSKLGLWKAIVASAASDLHDALAAAAAKDKAGAADSRADLKNAMAAYVAHLLAHPEVPRLILRDTTTDTVRAEWLLRELSGPLHQRFYDLAQAAVAECPGEQAYLQFRVATFIYSAASAVARRERLATLVTGVGDEHAFAGALEATLIDAALRCG
ncbi:TetR/AcrR family transcriptional regulator [Blastomonas fulva]|jgi:AcrR family transcriptional regulator|uniref:TetR/AcrR family transcriptional regulator n=1 Tax=Blastomonas fulva TaxID=1550728 RepID=UPI0025A37CD1|nr:TetR family transcriptional regulator [Blastomonas fulva]MDM7928024.1 TetR family transcriptional regulator [Blastomonas fulva]MDM7966539.1 TetR family transcriptional regulator [Blastomonas fulva]